MGFYQEKVFPFFVERALSTNECQQQRQQLLSKVNGTILEIGFGTGLNLPHYPAHVRQLTTIDINRGMLRRAQRRIDDSTIQVKMIPMSSESLPFSDESFDSVVSTWTLCSIAQIALALLEIHRVLKPQGRLFFLEHGLSPKAKIQKWQRRFNPIQKLIADGCHLDRDIPKIIGQSPLTLQQVECFQLAKTPTLAATHFRGTALKI